jgi:3-isopropylmalate/(R)-2-methylmalate dehydratase small subunit
VNAAVRAISGLVAILERDNLDTDQIIPARFLRHPRERGYREFLFHDLRRHPDGSQRADFPLNRAMGADVRILIAGANFGCGSAREGAVYALLDSGFEVVIAPSFGDIFKANALQNALLPVELPPDEVERIIAQVRGDHFAEISVDLETQEVVCDALRSPFLIDPFDRARLLRGLDETDLTLSHAALISEFEVEQQRSQPWISAAIEPSNSRKTPL